MIPLYIATFFLYIIGLLNLFGVERQFFLKDLIFSAVGLVIFFIVRKIGIGFFKLNAKFFYWAFVFFLLITYIIGFEAKGSRRWIDLYFFNFQPSEFFKIIFILFIADYFSLNRSA